MTRRPPSSFLALVLVALGACAPPAPGPPPVVANPPLRDRTPTTPTCPAAAPELPEDDASSEDRFSGLKIRRICLHGAGEETRGLAEKALEWKPGQPLSPEATRTSIERLQETRSFEDIRIGAEMEEGELVLHVALRERPRVEEIVVEPEGSRGLIEPLEPGRRADPYLLRGIAEREEEKLRQRGYGGAKVAMTLEPIRAGFARIHVKVEAGPTWTIARTLFPGASRARVAELEAASKLRAGDTWNAGAIRAVLLQLTAFYLDRGFVEARIQEPEQSVDGEGKVTLSWKIEEGAVFRLGKVSLRGPLVAGVERELRGQLRSRPGSTFQRSLIVEDVERIQKFYTSRGKKVEVRVSTELEKKVVQVEFEPFEVAREP
ncbi:MAG: hypothetical protein MUF64_10155 [Polyangiaceae bacterium]|nr:hypothetical protein [Polyangiaceae bacterium]